MPADAENLYQFKDSDNNLLKKILRTLQEGDFGDTNIISIGGMPFPTGQQPMASSMSVVIASNQTAIPVTVGNFPDPQNVNLKQVAGSVLGVAGAGSAAAGTQRVVTADDDANLASLKVVGPGVGTTAQRVQLADGAIVAAKIFSNAGYLFLDGVAGSKASTPDSAVLDIVADIDIRVALWADNWNNPSAGQSFAAKWTAAGNQRSYAFSINTDGTLVANTSSSGTSGTQVNYISTAATGFSNGTLHCARVTVDVDNGAGGKTATFYTKETTPQQAFHDCLENSGWTQLGAAVTSAGTTSIFNSTAALTLGSLSDNTLPAEGRVKAAIVLSGIGGTIASAIDFTDETLWYPGVTSGRDNNNAVWTLAGGAVIRGVEQRGIIEGGVTAEVNTRTDGIAALEVSDDMTSFESFSGTLTTSTDTTITFSQPVRLVHVKNWSISKRLLVKDGAIASDADAGAARIGLAPSTDIDNDGWFPFKTSSVHLRAAGTNEYTVEGYY